MKKLNKDDFKYLSQELNSTVLNEFKQKGFYPYKCMADFEKFKETWVNKEKFYSSLIC